MARSNIRILALLVLSAFLGASVAQAAPRRYQNSYVGVRPAAMGNAFTAVADDANALYYNPAGLARLTTWNLDLLSIILGVNSSTLKNSEKMADLADKMGQSTGGADQTIELIRPILSELSGETHHVRVGLNPSFVVRNFGLGLYSGAELDIVPHVNGLPTILDVSVLSDVGFRIGGAYTFYGKKLSVGATLNILLRSIATLEDFGVFDVADAAENGEALQGRIEEVFKSGLGFGTDVGMLFTPVELWSPTLGIAVKNVGDAGFYPQKVVKSAANAQAPEPVRQSVNVGLSITPRWGAKFVRGSLDFRDVNLPIPASKKLGFGGEAGIAGNYIKGSLLAGVSEGYFTAGFEADLFLFALRYATYVTELGAFPTEKPDRRHVIQMKVLM